VQEGSGKAAFFSRFYRLFFCFAYLVREEVKNCLKE